MYFLLLSVLASSAIALQNPTLCANGQGNEFACSVIEPVNNKDFYSQFPSIDNITIGKNGQSDFIKAAEAVEILRSSLRNKTNSEALKDSNSYNWFQHLAKATGQLESSKTGTQQLVNSAISGLKNLQESFSESNSTNSQKVEKTAAKAVERLDAEVDKRVISHYTKEYSKAVEQCIALISKQVETIQNRTRHEVEKSYDSLIELTDQIGLCIQSGDTEGKCARGVQTKLNALSSLPRISESHASKFEALGGRSFEKDPCLTTAVRRFDESVKKFLRSASRKG